MNSKLKSILSIKQIIVFFLCLFFFAIFIDIVKKMWKITKFKKKYHASTQFSIRTITNIAMTISLSVAIILILSFLTSGIFNVFFVAYPGVRILIEGILIKIGGLMFGPIVGVFIGAATDLLTIIISSCSFHYGFFFAAMFYGLIAGYIQMLWNFTKKNNSIFTFSVTILIFALATVLWKYINGLEIDLFQISIFGGKMIFKKTDIIWINYSIYIFLFAALWLIFIIRFKYFLFLFLYQLKFLFFYKIPLLINKNRFNKQQWANWCIKNYAKKVVEFGDLQKKIIDYRSLTKNIDWSQNLMSFSVIISAVILSEAVIGIFFLPYFDADFSIYPLTHWIVIRSFTIIFLSIINTTIIYFIFKISYNKKNKITNRNNC